MSDIVDAEAAMGRALARQAWRRLSAADSPFAMERYPGGEADYAETEWMRYREDASAALAGLSEVGWVVVPKEPTDEMLDAGMEYSMVLDGEAVDGLWHAVLASAPKVGT